MLPTHPVNEILDRVRAAAAEGLDLHLTLDETKLLAEGIGKLRLIPVLTMEQVAKLPGQPIGTIKDTNV
ncbi:hypothetical protein [Acinetobacter rudis]|uniref:hypothetical protein n=1 Tax=Acinetobacter rudis TaxID=632955 RepID=UPI003340730B